MEPENNQELTVEQAKAAMGNATMLVDQLIPGLAAQEGDQIPQETQEMDTESVETPQIDTQTLIQELTPVMAEMVQSAVKDEMDTFKGELRELINEEESSEEDTE